MPLRCGHWPVNNAARLGEQVGAAAEGAAEQHAFGRKPLQIRSWHRVAVRLKIAA